MRSVRESKQADVVAVLDASPEAMHAACELAPEAKQAATWDDMLALDLDGIVIATPNALHVKQSLDAMAHGMHVFCQKPLARTADETRRVVEAARENDLRLGVDLGYRHLQATRAVRGLLHQGRIGDVYALDLAFHNAYGPDKAWFYDRELSGGGCMLDLGIHLVDLALWTLDFPKVEGVSARLFAKGMSIGPETQDVEDYAVTRLDVAGGRTATIACSWGVSAGSDAVIGVTLHGTRGSLRIQNVGGSFLDFRADLLEGTRATPLVVPPDDWGGRAIGAWSEAVGRGEGWSDDALCLVDVASVLDEVYAR